MTQYQTNYNFKKTLVIFTCAISFMLCSLAFASISQDDKASNGDESSGAQKNLQHGNTISMELKDGVVLMELYPDIAPEHVKRIKELVLDGFYNGLSFHRVIDGFVVQTGDPTGTGAGGSSKPNLNAEFNKLSHVRGVLSMARTEDVNSANSQFFIVLEDAKYLDNRYTAFGKVVSGMEYVDKIKKGDPATGGIVKSPDKIIKMSIVKAPDNVIENEPINEDSTKELIDSKTSTNEPQEHMKNDQNISN